MKVLTEEEHEKNCFQFKPIPFTSRDRILEPTGASRSVLTNVRSTYVPISAPASVIGLALSQEQLQGSSRKAYMVGYKSVIEAMPKKQFEAFEEEQVEEQDDVTIADTASTRALPEIEQDLEGFTEKKKLKLKAKLKIVDELERIVEKGEKDPRVKESLDIFKAEERGLTNLEKRRGRPSGKPDAEAIEDERPKLRGRPKKYPLADIAEDK